MSFQVIDNPDYISKNRNSGFTNCQFKKLDALFLKYASLKLLNYRGVQCDFEEGVFEYHYHKTRHHPALYTFIIRRVGPRTTMYEVWLLDKGRVFKSGLFDRALNKLESELETLNNV
jgi:hypothetical protein